MAGSIYVATNLLTSATVTAPDGTASGSAVANLYNYRPGKTWISSVPTANQRINIDLGSVQPSDLMALLNHNFPLASSIKLAKSTTGAWAGEEVHIGTFTIRASSMYLSFEESSRYWSLLLEDGDGVGGAFPTAPKIGELSLGVAVQLSRHYKIGTSVSQNQRNIIHETPSGVVWMAHSTKTGAHSLPYGMLSDSERDEIIAWHDATAGEALPFTWVPDPDSPDATRAAEVRYVRMNDALGWTDSDNIADISVALTELPFEVQLS